LLLQYPETRRRPFFNRIWEPRVTIGRQQLQNRQQSRAA
jgi:hypothetical protein